MSVVRIPKARGPYDMMLDGVGLYLGSAPDPQDGKDLPVTIDGNFSPTEDKQVSDEPAYWDDWSLGMGYTQRPKGRGGYSYALGACTRVPGMIFPAGGEVEIDLTALSVTTGHTIVDATDYGSAMYLLTSGNQVLVMGPDGAWEIDGTITATGFAGQSIVAFNGELYASGGTGGIVRRLTVPVGDDYWADDTTNYGAAPVYKMCKVYWVVAGLGSFWLVGVFDESRSYFRRTDGDPLDYTDLVDFGAWSELTQVGDTTYPINSLAASNRVVAFVKTNGIHRVDSRGYAPNRTEYWEEVVDDENGLASIVFDGKVIASHVLGLDRVDISDMIKQEEPSFVQPGHSRPNATPIYGRITAMARSQGWLLASVWNGVTSYLVYGKEPAKLGIDSLDSLIWHGAEAWWPGEIVTWMKVSSKTGRPYLYVATTDDTTGELSIYAIYHPRASNLYQEWLGGESVDFRSAFTIYFTGEDYGDSNAKKVPRRGDLVADNLDRNHTIQVYAVADGASPSETLDDAAGVRYTLIPPTTGTYTISLEGYGTTAALSGVEEASPSTANEVLAELVALAPLLEDDMVVSGGNPLMITVPVDVTITTTGATLAWWFQGKASSSPRQAFLPSDSIANGFVISLRLDANANDDTPIIMRSLKLRSSVLIDQIESIRYPVKFGAGVRGKEGSVDGRDPLSTLAQVQALMNAAPVEMIDPLGRTSIVKVEPGLEYRIHEDREGWYIEAWVKVSVVKRPFYWDSGAIWDDNFIWS